MYNIKTFSFILLFAYMIIGITGLNEKQMKAAVKLVTNVCLPKSKASAGHYPRPILNLPSGIKKVSEYLTRNVFSISEDIEKMHKGDWDVDHTTMCFMHCALSSYKLFNKDNTFNYESALQQIGQLPESYKESAKMCTDQCRNSAVTLKDKCIAAHEVAKCVYFCNPEKYFLP